MIHKIVISPARMITDKALCVAFRLTLFCVSLHYQDLELKTPVARCGISRPSLSGTKRWHMPGAREAASPVAALGCFLRNLDTSAFR